MIVSFYLQNSSQEDFMANILKSDIELLSLQNNWLLFTPTITIISNEKKNNYSEYLTITEENECTIYDIIKNKTTEYLLIYCNLNRDRAITIVRNISKLLQLP